jgi:hypothetical protein
VVQASRLHLLFVVQAFSLLFSCISHPRNRFLRAFTQNPNAK